MARTQTIHLCDDDVTLLVSALIVLGAGVSEHPLTELYHSIVESVEITAGDDERQQIEETIASASMNAIIA